MQLLWMIIPLLTVSLPSSSSQELKRVGSSCKETSECVENSDCAFGTCQCRPGFTILSSLECRVDYQGQCSRESDCNTGMGLHCLGSVCRCVDEVYVFELGTCMNSSMSEMYHSIVSLINQTEVELGRFSTLLNLFMINSHSESMAKAEDRNHKDLTPSESGSSNIQINPIVYHRLENLERQLRQLGQQPSENAVPASGQLEVAEQTNDPVAVPAPPEITSTSTTTVASTTTTISNDIPEDPKAQQESPRQTVTLPGPLDAFINDDSIPVQMPMAPSAPEGTGNAANQAQNAFRYPPPNSQPNFSNNMSDNLTSVLPNFVSMFTQFLPFLQGFNNVLSSSILQGGSGGRGGGSGGGIGNIQGQNLTNPAGALGQSPAGGLSGLLAIPMRLIMIPGQLFNSVFGQNSPLTQLKQRLIPIDFSNRPIRILPFPFG